MTNNTAKHLKPGRTQWALTLPASTLQFLSHGQNMPMRKQAICGLVIWQALKHLPSENPANSAPPALLRSLSGFRGLEN